MRRWRRVGAAREQERHDQQRGERAPPGARKRPDDRLHGGSPSSADAGVVDGSARPGRPGGRVSLPATRTSGGHATLRGVASCPHDRSRSEPSSLAAHHAPRPRVHAARDAGSPRRREPHRGREAPDGRPPPPRVPRDGHVAGPADPVGVRGGLRGPRRRRSRRGGVRLREDAGGQRGLRAGPPGGRRSWRRRASP